MTAEMLWKATRPNGTDWWTGTVNYRAALHTGETLRHPVGDLTAATPAGYFSASTLPTECVGMGWPSAAFRVEPVGPTANDRAIPTKRRCVALRVFEEVPGHLLLGPQGEEVAAMLDRTSRLTRSEIARLSAATPSPAILVTRNHRDTIAGVISAAVWTFMAPTWPAVGSAIGSADLPDSWRRHVGNVLRAILATLTRDLIPPTVHDMLMRPWRDVIGDTP